MIYDDNECASIRIAQGDDFFLRSLHMGEALRMKYEKGAVDFECYSIEDSQQLINAGAEVVDFPDAINLIVNVYNHYRVEDNNGKLDIYKVNIRQGIQDRVYPDMCSIEDYTL
jgi:hypothetical protein